MRLVLAAVGILLLCSPASAQNSGRNSDMDRRFDKLIFTKGESSLPYRLLKPEGYDKDGKDRYPLVVLLHGIGERGDDNTRQLANGAGQFATDAARKKHPCFLVAPQCPSDKLWVNVTPRDTKVNLPLAKEPTEPAMLVLDLVDALSKEYRIDPDRIYLTGMSLGGYGTWELACRKPELFAAAIPICGGGDTAQAGKLAKLPVWAFHGSRDELVPVERSRDMVAAIKQAGGRPKYTEYEGVGHDSWSRTYRNEEVLDWLFAQKKGR